MERIKKIVSGNVAVIGKKSALNNIFHHVIEHCRTLEGKTFVLSGNAPAFSSSSSGENDEKNVLMGVYPEYKEVLPDFLELFLRSPSAGVRIDSVVSAMSDMFFSLAGPATGNDQYFTGTAEILFRELIRYSLLLMKKSKVHSFASFANCYTQIYKEFPLMIVHNSNNNLRTYSYSDSDLRRFARRDDVAPFSQTLVSNNPTTANNVEGTLRVHTPRMREFLSLISSANGMDGENGKTEVNKFSFLENLKQNTQKNDVVFLQMGVSLQSYQRLLFIFICESLRLLAEAHPREEFRLVIPDICHWKNPVTVSRLLQNAPRNLSVTWGVSSITVIEQLGRAQERLGDSMVSMSDAQVWARSGDAAAQRIYETIVPEVMRTYRLSQMPEQLCFVRSDQGDFGAVTIPEVSQLQNSQNTQNMQEQYAEKFSLWIDEEDERMIEDDELDDERNDDDPDDDDISFEKLLKPASPYSPDSVEQHRNDYRLRPREKL